MPIIFIIAGKCHSGKDTVSKYIEKYTTQHNLRFIKLQFSSYIKNYAKLITNWDGNEDNKPRKLLQELGEDIRNNYNNKFFIDRVTDDINILSKYTDIIAITDARLPLEINLIKERFSNSYSIKIVRDNYNNNLPLEEANHITEIALDNYSNFDYMIHNNNLSDLEDIVNNMLDNILNK